MKAGNAPLRDGRGRRTQGLYSLGGSRPVRGIGAGHELGRNLLLVRTEPRYDALEVDLPRREASVQKKSERGEDVNRDELKHRLKVLLIGGLKLEDKRPEDIQDAEPIFVEGLGLDSIDALELVVLIEEHFHVSIPDEEVGRLAFASIDALADFILASHGAVPSPQP